MSCLFGDATDSELELDYILLIRDLFDFAVDVLRADELIDEVDQALRSSAKAAGREKARLEALYGRLAEALDPEMGGTEGAASRCADAIGRACRSTIDEEVARLESEVSRERALADKARGRQRKACAKALEKLLLVPHDLPGAESELDLTLNGELGYSATLTTRTDYGLETVLELGIDDACFFGGPPVRVGQKVAGLELHLPEQRGWISKKVKRIKHKVSKHVITRVKLAPTRITICIRTEATLAGEGFDLVLDADWDQPRVFAVDADSMVMTDADAQQVDEADAQQVRELFTALVDAADPIRGQRTALVDARLDGIRIEDHEDPTELVDRLFQIVGPTVKEIAEHTPQADELVLKRRIGGDRREEIYVSRKELAAKLEALTPDQRARFTPLGFGAKKSALAMPPMPPRAKAPSVPPPMPAKRVPSPPKPPRAESEPANP